MKFLRNPEVRRLLLLEGLFAVLVIFIGFSITRETGLLLILVSGGFILSHLLYTMKRYRNIAKLTEEMDDVLHKEQFSPISAYEEGELSILRTQIHKMNKKLEEQRGELLHEKIYLSESLADISHQIRTPLTALNLIGDLLLEEHLDTGRRKSLVKEQMKLLDQIDWLISALLKMAKLDANTAKMSREKVYVRELIKRAVEPLAIAMDVKDQELLIEQEGEESYMGDLHWSGEALLNILKNCMEHTPMGGVLRISVTENVLFTEIVIRDNGPGIHKEDLPHLFERFYKGKTSSQTSVGIGLALSRMIITQQGGTLKAENNASGGAGFTIRFYKGKTQELKESV
ncbi:sensor histidine kinase [Proteiniclasticum sp. C24MP]|uniref:sensor histidine kinase n=1 Tax=Proteiniclasticum sp. C24MP TaxID=3374101 RepID=UPI0037551EFD